MVARENTMLHKLPKYTPPLALMLHDIGNPHPAALGHALGVSRRTVYHWLAHDCAPRPALLSVFWLTRWGAQWLDADLYNLARDHAAMNEALRRELTAHVTTAPGLPPAPPLLHAVR